MTSFSAPIIGIFGGAGAPVFRAMMSKIVSADDQGIKINVTHNGLLSRMIGSLYQYHDQLLKCILVNGLINTNTIADPCSRSQKIVGFTFESSLARETPNWPVEKRGAGGMREGNLIKTA